jgi:L-lactate dehydrogenase complex protein LldG
VKQDKFIRRIQTALAFPGDPDGRAKAIFSEREPGRSEALVRRIQGRTLAERRTLCDRLRQAAQPLNLNVLWAPEAGAVAASIRELVQAKTPEWGDRKSLVVWNHPLVDALALPRVLADQKVPVHCADMQPLTAAAREAFRQHVVDAYIGVTSADYCLADTATLVMKTRPGQARSVSLVPSIHIAVIHHRQIIADLQELYALLKTEPSQKDEGLTNCMTFISGPSKTADIEATLVHGAHGPREVYLYVVGP